MIARKIKNIKLNNLPNNFVSLSTFRNFMKRDLGLRYKKNNCLIIFHLFYKFKLSIYN